MLEAEAAASNDAETALAGDQPSSVFNMPLWPGSAMPDGVAAHHDALRDFFARDPALWGFWARWYDGLLTGAPLDWDLQKRIALIPDEDWEAGAARIAKLIAVFKRDMLLYRAPLAEDIVFNTDTNRFRAIPRDIAKPDLVAATLLQVEDALDDALADPSNGLNATSREVRVVRRMLERYAGDPQQIELNLVSVAVSLRHQMFTTEDLPQAEANTALLRAAEEGAVAIRATHPEVEKNRKIIATQSFQELPPEDKALLAEAQPQLVAVSEGQVAEDFAHDIPELLNTSIGPEGNYAPPLPGVMRTFGRIARISAEVEKPGLLARIENDPAYRSVRIVGTTASFADLLSQLVQIGLRLFGVL